jgi:DNA mismatch endonuclease, patch repair protein
MTDIVDTEARSRMMSGIKGKDTKPELIVRKFLHAQGLRYRLHQRGVPGRPDLVFPRRQIALFVHGCFWHRHEGCRYAYNPKSNVEKWQRKFAENSLRDAKDQQALIRMGWRVLIVWECALKAKDCEKLLSDVADEIVLGDSDLISWPR